MRPTRAVAYAESALAALGERRDRHRHAVLEAGSGGTGVAAGDASGATAALRKAGERRPGRSRPSSGRGSSRCSPRSG